MGGCVNETYLTDLQVGTFEVRTDRPKQRSGRESSRKKVNYQHDSIGVTVRNGQNIKEVIIFSLENRIKV